MNLEQVVNYIQSANNLELRVIIEAINEGKRRKDALAKAGLQVNDRVTSHDPRWIYGVATIVKINKKKIKLQADNGQYVNASPSLLTKVFDS